MIDTLAGPYSIPEYGWIADPSTGAGRMVNPPALAATPPWSLADGSLIRLDPTTATVEFRDVTSGEIARLLRLPYVATSPSAEERDAFFKGLQEDSGLPDDAIAHEREVTAFTNLRPPVAGLLIDERLRVWVALHEPSVRGRGYVGSDWDVYDLEREAVVRVRFPRHFHLVALRNEKAYGITTTDTGVHVIDVFEFAGLPVGAAQSPLEPDAPPNK